MILSTFTTFIKFLRVILIMMKVKTEKNVVEKKQEDTKFE